jgi:hypothetical protein
MWFSVPPYSWIKAQASSRVIVFFIVSPLRGSS